MGRDILFILAIGIIGVVTWVLTQQWMMKRSSRQVIHIFRKYNAIGIQNAKTVEELGLKRRPRLQSMFRRRDWKPQALAFLIHNNVVFTTEDGKLYITEESVASATWLKLNN